MQCFLLDADKQQNKNAVVRKWVTDIRDLALEAEDLVEMYIVGVSHKRQQLPNDAWCKSFCSDLKWLAKLGCFWDDAKKLHTVGSDIAALTLKISKLRSRLKTYGIKNSHDKGSTYYSINSKRRRAYAYSHVMDRDVVGLEDHIKNLADTLMNDNQKVVVIHGMGGIGKTTLAREVYNYAPLRDHFAGLAWAYVSQELQLESVCKDILHQLIPEKELEKRKEIEALPASQLPGKLYAVLKEKNYLVVLDDVWSRNDWECLKPAFPLNEVNSVSKLLLTTRNPGTLPDIRKDICKFEAVFLDHDRSWELLKKKAHLEQVTDPKMVELGDKMLDHCKGHPLAIVVLGGVLATKEVEEWESVYDNLSFHLQGDEPYSGVYEVLAMSYYDLPYNIKPCFLQLGNFPEDFEIPTERLYDLWIGEGIISSENDQVVGRRSLEDVAEVYLNELVQKSMVQAGNKDFDGRMNTCRMHDLMGDKCLELALEENFLQIVDSRVDKQQKASPSAFNEKLRRLAIYVDGEACRSLPDSSSRKTLPVRSLLFFPVREHSEENCEWLRNVCNAFQFLRVLDFGGLRLHGSLPDEIGNLLFLRYLSLKDTQITELPSSIGNLRSLLILDLRVCCAVIKLPNVLWKMRYLRHLYLPSKILSQEVSSKQGYQIIGEGLEMLILDRLSYLEKLEDVDLDRVNVKGLQELRRIRKLSALCRTNKESLLPFLKSSSIKNLSLKVHARLLVEDEMMFSGCHFLKYLDIEAERSRPTSLPIKLEMFPCNLVNLALWYCELPGDPMPVLEKLPKLRYLAMHICYNVHELVCTAEGFPELTYLMIDGLFWLTEWEVENGGLPKLEKVEIHNSPISKLPDALSTHVKVHCWPCLRGHERHGTCPYEEL